MAVRIRLTRVGATKRPAYRVIAIDKRRSRDGRALEILGYYDPLTEPATVHLESDRISAWIGQGAQPSDTVVRLMRQAEKAAASPTPAEKPKRPTRPKAAAKAKGAAKAKATEAADAPVEQALPAEPAEAPEASEADATTAAVAQAETEPSSEDAPADESATAAKAAEPDA